MHRTSGAQLQVPDRELQSLVPHAAWADPGVTSESPLVNLVPGHISEVAPAFTVYEGREV